MFWEWWQSLFTDMTASSFFNFSFLPKYGQAVIQGVEYTLILSVVSVLMAVLPAFLLATMRLSKNKIVRCISGSYIAVFRSTPILVQLMIIYYGVFSWIIIPRFTIFGFIDASRFIPGVVALALNSSAYVAEIFRAGILAVDSGQMEAARSLGLSQGQSMRLVVLPQAIKNVLPALANEFIVLLKETSVASFVSVADLTYAGNIIGGNSYDYLFPLLMTAMIYLAMVMFFSYLVSKLERRLRNSER
jgi:polar amino acid transport system permease protein